MADCRICVQDCSIHEDVWKALKENCRNYKPKPMTNADKLRSMSDEELAEFCVWMCPPGSNENLTCEPERKLCYKCWLDWLRQEAQDG